MRVLLPMFVVWLGILCFVAGLFASDFDHRSDYRNGWNAGYAARESIAQSEDRKLMAAGLCAYAGLVCKEARK